MPPAYVRYILFKGARKITPQAATYDFDQQAQALADGEAWILGGDHTWYAVFGQAQNGQLTRIAGEST